MRSCFRPLPLFLLAVSTVACNAPRDRSPVALGARGMESATSDVAARARARRVAQEQAVPLGEELKRSLAADDHRQSLAIMERLDALQVESEASTPATRFRVLLQSGDTDAAYRYAAKVEQTPQTDGRLFDALARAILDTPNVAERDLILARRYARQAKQFNDNPAAYAGTLERAMGAGQR